MISQQNFMILLAYCFEKCVQKIFTIYSMKTSRILISAVFLKPIHLSTRIHIREVPT